MTTTTSTTVPPRIYVADLACYVAGSLVGRWITIDASMTVEELHEIVERRVLRPGHEEWAIHDFEGFGSIGIREYDSFATVLDHVRRMGEDQARYFAYIDGMGEHCADQFDDYEVVGPFESEAQLAWEDFDSTVLGDDTLAEWLQKKGVPEYLASAVTFDTDAYCLMLQCNQGVTIGRHAGQVYSIREK